MLAVLTATVVLFGMAAGFSPTMPKTTGRTNAMKYRFLRISEPGDEKDGIDNKGQNSIILLRRESTLSMNIAAVNARERNVCFFNTAIMRFGGDKYTISNSIKNEIPDSASAEIKVN